ncbi:hypothetical protein NEMBOFW57_003660 [Staphylotrichum longicolle]|uniref:lytic cellulose monooxygenase (C4-dehydrogenating) n=1 Tax=Staphylotrichum longicolle TaxID=669026 RepID=A0AAD4F5D9_9PEZI|nr:hypothetical protein NEMBOFW57_003660 [Staphylotrichum longicolle]
MACHLSLAVTFLATQVAAHGYINTFTLDNVDYEGFSRSTLPPTQSHRLELQHPDEGPEVDISSPDFVCRRGSEPSSNYGHRSRRYCLVINPNGWAEGHRGPVLTYIAPCNGDCASVDKASLRWTKIAESGLVSGPANTEGVWATDVLRENGGINSATIPKSIAPGKYVLRNEIIALHRAHINEPEFYMQCGNIEVTGDGTDDLSGVGVPAAKLYSKSDSQLFGFSVHDSKDNEWPIPGPALYGPQTSQPSQKPSPSPSPQQSRKGSRLVHRAEIDERKQE